jgi:uncharacterized protein YjeT (DUF2065 family)
MDFNYFLSVLGLVLIIEGFPYFVFPDKLKNFLSQIPNVPDRYLRSFGICAMLLGLLLLYIARGRISL